MAATSTLRMFVGPPSAVRRVSIVAASGGADAAEASSEVLEAPGMAVRGAVGHGMSDVDADVLVAALEPL